MGINYQMYKEMKRQRDQVRKEKRANKKEMQRASGEVLGYMMGNDAFLSEQLAEYERYISIYERFNHMEEKA